MSRPRAERMHAQQWLYDRLIQASGPDFYWGMTGRALRTVGADGVGDIQSVRSSIRKFLDITREMRRLAQKREGMAKKAEAEGHLVTARQNYFCAAAYYLFAQGPIHEDDNAINLALSTKKNACYEKFIQYAGHRIEKVEIPFEKTSLPGYLHFPNGVSGKVPCVVSIGGMDVFKEMMVTSPSDKFLERGLAVLAIDGPGQNEAILSRKIRCTEDNFITAGKQAMDHLLARKEIDPDRIGIFGNSMGSFWITQIVAHDHRYSAAAGTHVCHESGMHTIFNLAIPIFKDRYMWMAGYEDEEEFDRFARKLTLEGLGSRITCPYLTVAGEDDHLSPIEFTYKLHDEIRAPNTLVVYKGEGHGLADAMDVSAYIADWMNDRFAGKPLQPRRIYMESRTGQEVKQP